MAQVGKLSTFMERVMRRVGKIDADKLQPEQTSTLPELIDVGLASFSMRRPRTATFEAAGSDTTARYVLSTLIGATWIDNTSTLLSVAAVSNANLDTESEQVLPTDEWSVSRATDGTDILRLANGGIGASRTLRLVYSSPHVISTTVPEDTTVREADAELLTTICAAEVCSWIARTASDFADNTLGADQIDFGEISTRFAQRASELRKSADGLTSVPAEQQQAGGSAVTWDTRHSSGTRWVGH